MAAVKKKRSLFNPDKIATSVYQALCDDLDGVSQLYNTTPESERLASAMKSDFLKKYKPLAANDDGLDDRTYSKFFAVCDHMRSAKLPSFDGFKSCQINSMSPEQSVLWRARALIHQVLGQLDEDQWFDACRNSSGVSQGVSFEDTSPEAKLTLPISTTIRTKPLLDRFMLYDVDLYRAVDNFNGNRPFDDWYDIVRGSSATTVPKNADINRMIAIEPTGNMFFQQGLMVLMYDCLARFGLDVRDLPKLHMLLAQTGSITGLTGTIDWSSASDCVLYELVKFLFPPSWFWALDIVRCPVMDVAGVEIELPMFSTMGNATTFPIETLIFWALGEATVMHDSGTNSTLLSSKSGKVSVFGDDCILPVVNCETFLRVATSVGFIVNEEKSSFAPVPGFRESCGGDFFRGYDVRPLHLRAPPSNRVSSRAPWLYSILNRLITKYKKVFGPISYLYDKGAIREILRELAKEKEGLFFVPPFFPDDAGLHAIDLQRLRIHYEISCSTLAFDCHGSVAFRYKRFIYRNRSERDIAERDDHIQLALWYRGTNVGWESFRPEGLFGYFPALSRKWPAPSNGWLNSGEAGGSGEPLHRNKRRNGGYVVAKAVSSCWSPSGDLETAHNTRRLLGNQLAWKHA